MRHWLTGTVPVALLMLWAVLAIGAQYLPLQPDVIHLQQILEPPGDGAVLGYDDLGRDILERMIVGARTSFLVAAWVVSLSLLVGTLLGTASAYHGGWWDRTAVLLVDVFLAFPGILLAIALAGLLGPGIDNVVIALTTVGWVGYARLARSQAMTLRTREHITAAIALGSGQGRIVFRHLLPLMMAPLLVEASFGLAAVIVAEAGLSFLGLGVQPPQASWGSMIREGAGFLLVAPHLAIFPGIAIMLVVLSANLLGDWMRDRLDVRQNL